MIAVCGSMQTPTRERLGIIPALMKIRTLIIFLLLALVRSSAADAHARVRQAAPANGAQAAEAAAARTITGTVHDSAGGVISGALVIARSANRADQQTITGVDGTYTLSIAPDADTLIVRAGGFAEQQQRLPNGSTSVDVVLMPAGLLETVVVTATRSEERLGNVPASVNVLTHEDIQASPAVMADDVFRQAPTFSLFRRTSSLVAQPTTQGVSLRGIGPSGQSRTLVLLDGIPFNDPFGGWVYWTRVPLLSVDRVEITDDPASSLYGNSAMGGVINIVTAKPTRQTIEVKPQYGDHNSPKFDFFASDRWKKVAVAVEGSYFNTDGFPIVAAPERGPIDNNADVNYRNTSVKLEFTPTERVNAFVRGAYFSEARNNGKVGELNDTRWTTTNGGVRIRMPDESDLQAHVFVDVERSHFNFLAVTNAATTRNLVRLATDQHVPTNGVGGTVQWSKALGARNLFSAGGEWRWVDGDSQEDAYVPAVPTVIIPPVTQQATLSVQRVSGGTQQIQGAFLQDVFTVSKLVVTLSARVDRWRNYDGHNLETTVSTGLPTANNRPSIPERSDTVVSPRAAALYHLSDRISVWGAGNSGFRAPTLTELYRQFSVGAVTTFPNAQLGPERLVGGEAGVNVAPTEKISARLTWFDNRVSDPVLNVTLTPTQAQKQNLGEIRVHGFQTDVEYRLKSAWRISGAYLYNQAKVTDGGVANAALVGKYVPQVPVHRGSIQVAYSNPRFVNVAVGMQFVGLQYNDDQNVQFIPVATLVDAGYDATTPAGLPGFATLDLMASRDFGNTFQVFFGAQNLFDKTYFVQTNPSTIGTPRMVNGGVRIRLSGK
jgi:outer membrane receptor protein involved in Fe transport